MKILRKRMTRLNNYDGVCKTAPATPCLLTTCELIVAWFYCVFLAQLHWIFFARFSCIFLARFYCLFLVLFYCVFLARFYCVFCGSASDAPLGPGRRSATSLMLETWERTQLHNYTSTQLHNYTTTQLYDKTTTQ